MDKSGNIAALLESILKALTTPKATPFYNQPIFLTLISILLGGIFLTIITKQIEQRSKKRALAITFLEEVANSLNEILACIAGFRKRKKFGQELTSELEEKRGNLFRNMFSVKVKSKAFLGSYDFSEKYHFISFEIDKAVSILRKIKSQEDEKLLTELKTRQNKLEKNWPLNDDLALLQEFDLETHYKFYELEKMLWVRANSLIAQYLEKVM